MNKIKSLKFHLLIHKNNNILYQHHNYNQNLKTVYKNKIIQQKILINNNHLKEIQLNY